MLETACIAAVSQQNAYIRLVAEHGADMSVPELLRILSADCPR
jgi:hypothetical protein